MHDPAIIKHAVANLGYRMYDCASMYQNEDKVGEAMRQLFAEQTVKREELFVISKAWFTELVDVEAACHRSLKALGLEQLDMYLVHWPVCMKEEKTE